MNDTDIIAAIAPDAVSLMDKAIAEIKRLRQENATLTAERDEARRMYCRQTADSLEHYREPERIAEDRNWDCFKIENTSANSEKTGEEHLSLAHQEEARQAWYDNTYGPCVGEFDDQDDYDPREDEDLDEEAHNHSHKEGAD